MKIVCPDCKEKATLADNFTTVECDKCGYKSTYGEYVKYIAYKDPRYSDILTDYKEKKN
jgi:Zn ribbon nucleic-acid-binding protein